MESECLTSQQWERLLNSVLQKKCTPFIGPDAYAAWLPSVFHLGSKLNTECGGYPLALDDFETLYKIARTKYGYPLEEANRLAKIAQYLAIKSQDEMYPKEFISSELKRIKAPNFTLKENDNTPYSILADLNLPLYITTNYDYFMEESLRNRGGKEPVTEFCRWNEKLYNYTMEAGISSVFDKGKKYKPSPQEPLVYHLHGVIDEPQSMVLTEKDYIDFAINLNKSDEKTSLPTVVRMALAKSSLLFIGYRLEDITFRVVFQGVIRMLGEITKPFSVAVQFPTLLQGLAKEYLNSYTKNMFDITACWCELAKFTIEFRKYWDQFKKQREMVI